VKLLLVATVVRKAILKTVMGIVEVESMILVLMFTAHANLLFIFLFH